MKNVISSSQETRLPQAGVLYFNLLPDHVQQQLLARVSGANRGQLRVPLGGIFWKYFWAVILCGWLGILYEVTGKGRWSDEQICWLGGLTAVVALIQGSLLRWILKWHSSPLRSWLLITPLYVMKTQFGKVSFWPIWEITGLEGTHNIVNGAYTGTTVVMTFKSGIEKFTISPESAYGVLVETLRIFDEKVRLAAQRGDNAYLQNADDFYGLAPGARGKGWEPRWPSTIGYLIPTLLCSVALALAYTSDLKRPNSQPESAAGYIAPSSSDSRYSTSSPSLSPPSRSGSFDDFSLTSPSVRSTPPPFLEPELALPPSGELVRRPGVGKPIAPLAIKSTTGSHYLVKLVDVKTRKDVLSVFVRGGSPVEVDVPLGTYEVKYASGDKWYGYEHLFGPETSCSKADELFTFERIGNQINGFTITLYRVMNGNLRTESIPRDQF